MVDFTGPWGMTKAQVDDFYMRWREVMLVAARHKAIVVASTQPDIKAFFVDMSDRLSEDNWWILGMAGKETPVMMFRNDVPRDTLLFHITDPITKGTQLVPIQQVVNSAKGFGRFANIKAPTREGVRPFDTMLPKIPMKVPKPDDGNIVKPPPEMEDDANL
jgi:hypothetical protein